MERKNVQRPYAIFSDGYPAHMDLEIYKWCRERGIIYIIFFPNCTHVLQPCDLVLFKAIKGQFHKESVALKIKNNLNEIDEVDFITILARAIRNGITAETIQKGFKSAGLHPFNRANIHDERLLGNAPQARDGADNSSVPVNILRNAPKDVADNSLPVEISLPAISEGIVETDGLSKNQLLNNLLTLTKAFSAACNNENPHAKLHCAIIEQQVEMLRNLTQSDDQPLAAPVPNKPSSSAALSSILKPPPPNVRKRTRQVKVPKCGIMTKEDVIDATEKVAAEKVQKEEEMQERKRVRLEKAALSIKKEKVEKNIRLNKRK